MAKKLKTLHRLVQQSLGRESIWTDETTKTLAAPRLNLIAQIDYALFTKPNADDRSFRARTMAYRKAEDDGDLWFFTKRDSQKVKEVSADEKVLVTFADPKKQHFVSISGRASIATDRHTVHALWSELFRPWFPNGADDEDVVLLRVEADQAEYWDTPAGVMVNAFGYVRALTTGKPSLRAMSDPLIACKASQAAAPTSTFAISQKLAEDRDMGFVRPIVLPSISVPTDRARSAGLYALSARPPNGLDGSAVSGQSKLELIAAASGSRHHSTPCPAKRSASGYPLVHESDAIQHRP